MSDRSPAINGWIYFLGEMRGEDIKIGRSTGKTLRDRIASVNADQMTGARYELLAGLRGDPKDEAAVKRYFRPLQRDDKGTRTEYFIPAPELAEYVNWLRQWWWVAVDQDVEIGALEAAAPDHWLPTATRRVPCPKADPELLIQPFQDLNGSLAGSPWDWLISPKASVQDYFTPLELVEAAREAMGGIDLDAASHPVANRELRIPDYFHINRSAFEHDWYGRVWLNPPYGNNAPWFERILQFLDAGAIDQLCMLSPMWAFTAAQARPVMERSAATVLLSPTPEFWGNAQNRTGSNHPHAIVYFGPRVAEFMDAFAPYGIPLAMVWDRVPVLTAEVAA
jgi:hypothetical protein